MSDKKILIIDDDSDYTESLKIVLEKAGFKVFCAADKQQGLEQIDQSSPHLLILDVMLEKMCDGFDLARKLKSEEKYKHIPILMLTAVGATTGFSFCAGAGDNAWLPVNDFVEKPLAPAELIAKVKKLLTTI